MKKSVKVFLMFVVILLLLGGGIFIYMHFFKEKPKDIPPVNEVKITNSIDQYGYTLEDRDTSLFKEKFEEMKTLLNEEDFDKEEYIKLVSELFIIDLYTIDNKISRYDVGGLEFVYSEAVESFRTVIQNSIYKTVENNLDDTRTQELPIVSSVLIGEISETTYKMVDESVVDGYKVKLSWEYKSPLGYDNEATLILIPDNNKYGVVFYKSK